MGRFWDERAREDAMFFVDDREPYGNADAERFWAQGERDLDHILSTLGTRIASGDRALMPSSRSNRTTAMRPFGPRPRSIFTYSAKPASLLFPGKHNVQD